MLTEIKLRQIIRKMIMEVTGAEAEQFTASASKVRNQNIPEKEKVGEFKKTLGTNDKEFNDKIKQLGNLLGITFDPVKEPQVINTVLEKALAKLK